MYQNVLSFQFQYRPNLQLCTVCTVLYMKPAILSRQRFLPDIPDTMNIIRLYLAHYQAFYGQRISPSLYRTKATYNKFRQETRNFTKSMVIMDYNMQHIFSAVVKHLSTIKYDAPVVPRLSLLSSETRPLTSLVSITPGARLTSPPPSLPTPPPLSSYPSLPCHCQAQGQGVGGAGPIYGSKGEGWCGGGVNLHRLTA